MGCLYVLRSADMRERGGVPPTEGVRDSPETLRIAYMYNGRVLRSWYVCVSAFCASVTPPPPYFPLLRELCHPGSMVKI